MKRTSVVLLVVVAVMLCFGLAGCGGKNKVDPSAFYGTWNLYSLQSTTPDNSFSHEDILLMEELGYSASMTLNEDGTFVMNLYDEITEGKWSAISDTEGELVVDDEKATMVLRDGMIDVAMTAEDTLTFAKVGAPAGEAAAAEGAEAAAPESAPEVVPEGEVPAE